MLWGLGRLRPGTSIGAAAAEADLLSARLAAQQPEREVDQRATVIPMWRSPFGAQTYMLPAIAAAERDGRAAAPHRLRQRLQPRARARRQPARRDRRPRGARRQPRTDSPAAARREPRAVTSRRGAGPADGARPLDAAPRQQHGIGCAGPDLHRHVDWTGRSSPSRCSSPAAARCVFGFIPALRSSKVNLAGIMKDDLSPRARIARPAAERAGGLAGRRLAAAAGGRRAWCCEASTPRARRIPASMPRNVAIGLRRREAQRLRRGPRDGRSTSELLDARPRRRPVSSRPRSPSALPLTLVDGAVQRHDDRRAPAPQGRGHALPDQHRLSRLPPDAAHRAALGPGLRRTDRRGRPAGRHRQRDHGTPVLGHCRSRRSAGACRSVTARGGASSAWRVTSSTRG